MDEKFAVNEYRVTIKDIAEELGVSTATVSNVIHGKTKKISQQTVARVQEKIEEKGYLPNMAAVLLAQNTSKIVCIVLSNDVTTIKHKGQSYPAFRVNLETALRYMDQYQYGIVVDNKVITARQVVSMGPSVYEKFTLSPTKTGIFVQVKPLQNSLFYNNVEKQLKGKM